MDGMFVIKDNSSEARLACCMVSFIFVFIILIAAICWTNQENFENFTDNIKYSNDTAKNILGGGFHYKALGPKDDVLKKFKTLDKSNKVALVAVLAPWCGYCKRLKESGDLRRVASRFPVVVLDDKHPQVSDVMHLLQAEGFPALGIYFQGQLLPYRGPRDKKTILATMDEIKANITDLSNEKRKYSATKENFGNGKVSGQVSPIPKNMSKSDYNKLINRLSRETNVVTAFMADWCGHCQRMKQSGILEQLADNGFVVFIADDKNRLTQDMKVQGFPTIYAVVKGRNVPYQGERSLEGIMSFVK